MLIWYHLVAFSIGVILDLIIGDPYSLPHPIRLIGSGIGKLDHLFMDQAMESGVRNPHIEKRKGFCCVLVVVSVTLFTTAMLVGGAYWIHPAFGVVTEAILTGYCLAAKSLKTESMKVYDALRQQDVEAARYAVSMIVGRDTATLDEVGITKAAVETVAENTSDGVIAPMLALLFAGPVAGMTYKAINTMDSMIGYHNDRYEQFGKLAAKLDDVVNFVPARCSAFLMILAACVSKEFSGKNAFRIFKRDRFCHKSPNSAQTESVCAGALRIQLAGDAYYFGKLVPKPYIGDPDREIEPEDIVRVNRLMYRAMLLLVILGEVGLLLVAI